MNSNANLLKNIFSFLNTKDLSNVELVCKNYNQIAKQFEPYWRESCNDHFCSYYEHYKLIDSKEFDKNYKEYFSKCLRTENNFEWKRLFKLAVKNRIDTQNFNFSESLSYLKIEEDFGIAENFISSTLKEFLALPKLRRENFNLENELNTIHQIHNFEFLYEQQDLYDYYEQYFNQGIHEDKIHLHGIDSIQNYMLNNLEIKRDDLPFSTLLQNYMDILCLINKNDNLENRLNLGKLRWYSCDEKFIFNCNTKDETINDNIETENPINFILRSITSKIIMFCRITLNYIKKYKYNREIIQGDSSEYNQLNQNMLDKLFLNEFIKRYKAFSDAAIHINEEMENLNVLVNFLYEHIFQNYPSNPKFSIYRLMVVIWNKEVLNPLITTGDENLNLIKKIQNVYRHYLISNLNNHSKESKKKDYNDCFSRNISSFSSNLSSSILFNGNSIPTDNSRSSNISLYQDFTYELKDDYYSADMTCKYLIEQASASILDADCNEYSVFYVNYSKMKISQNYSILEESLMETTRQVIKNYLSTKPENINTILHILANSDSNIHFINRTQIQLLHIKCEMCVEYSVEDLAIVFQEFLQNNLNNFNEKERENYFKYRSKCELIEHDDFTEESEKIKDQLIVIAQEYLKNTKNAEYATENFLREIKKTPSFTHNLKTIQEGILIYQREEEKLQEINKKILKENKRRNIPLNHSESDEILLRYETVDLNELDQIFIKIMDINTDIFEIQLTSQNEAIIDEKCNGFYTKGTKNSNIVSVETTLNSSYDHDYGVPMELDL